MATNKWCKCNISSVLFIIIKHALGGNNAYKHISSRKLHCRICMQYLSPYHNSGVIMSTMASQITRLSIVCTTVGWRRRSKKISNLRVTGLCEGNSPVTGGFPSQRVSNAENVSIWWHQDVSSPMQPLCFYSIIRLPGRGCQHLRKQELFTTGL